jgi:hypothetical protein
VPEKLAEDMRDSGARFRGNKLHSGNLDIANHVRNTLDRQMRNEHAGYRQGPIRCTIHGLIVSGIGCSQQKQGSEPGRMVGGTRTRRGNSSSVLSHKVAPRRRVPALYLAHAIRGIVAILAVRGMNNLPLSRSAQRGNICERRRRRELFT